MYKLGIDLGGTKIEGIILDENHKQLFRERFPTQQELGYEHILNNIVKLYEKMTAKIDSQEHGFGIGTPGSISPHTRLMRNSNTLCLNEMPLKDDLEKRLGKKITMQNDANCFALAEAVAGAGLGKDLVFGVIMGTGCGGGIVFRGEALTGKNGISGEWGHSSIDPDGPECWCGARGCIETFISGGGIEKRYQKIFGQQLSATDIFARYRHGETSCLQFVGTFFEHFGQALANLINILDPDIVVIGGGLSNFDALYAVGAGEVRKRVFSDFCETPIVKNELGDSAGVIGAALIGR